MICAGTKVIIPKVSEQPTINQTANNIQLGGAQVLLGGGSEGNAYVAYVRDQNSYLPQNGLLSL